MSDDESLDSTVDDAIEELLETLLVVMHSRINLGNQLILPTLG
ncbi:hypothetical protein [Ferrimicrobium sp.]|nr:hypothetical protein [Ferrimicrobium sp.]